jgi:hypothetical protein
MATTTNYSWSTPDDTALVKDGASAIRTLGSSVDTTVKNLNPETTLGDLAYRSSTANVKTRLGLGTAGQVLIVNSGANAPEWAALPPSSPTSASAIVATSETTTSTSYTNLTTAGPAVTLTTGTKALVIVSAASNNGGASGRNFASYKVSGATTIASSDTVAQYTMGGNVMRNSSASRLSSLTAGSNTFTMEYRVSGSTGTFLDRQIIVIDLGS